MGKGPASQRAIVFWHGITCDVCAIANIIRNMPQDCLMIAPLFTPQWSRGIYSSSSHRVSLEDHWYNCQQFLTHHGLAHVTLVGWSFGCLLMHGFFKRHHSRLVVSRQVVIEPLTTFSSLGLAYAGICRATSILSEELDKRSGRLSPSMSRLFAILLNHACASRAYWKMLPLRNMYWGRQSDDTLLLLTKNDPLTSLDFNEQDPAACVMRTLYYPGAVVKAIEGSHGAWPYHASFASVLQEWIG
jgi:hypothetical protein